MSDFRVNRGLYGACLPFLSDDATGNKRRELRTTLLPFHAVRRRGRVALP